MVKTVIFDIDGTMYDYGKSNRLAIDALEEYCCRLAGISEAEFRRLLWEAEHTLINRIGYPCASVHNRLIRYQCLLEALGQPLFPHVQNLYHLYWDTFLEQMEPFPGLIDWMKQLKQKGIRFGIGTNMTAYMQYRKLERLGVESLIDWLVTSEEAGVEKPDPRFYNLCLDKSGHQAEECLFIGDSESCDVDGPVRVGMKAVMFGPKTGQYQNIQDYTEAGILLSAFFQAD